MPFDQATTARWMGYEGDDAVERMNDEHDLIHEEVAHYWKTVSNSLRQASGESLTPEQERLSWMEEDAILHLQRYLQHSRKYYASLTVDNARPSIS